MSARDRKDDADDQPVSALGLKLTAIVLAELFALGGGGFGAYYLLRPLEQVPRIRAVREIDDDGRVISQDRSLETP